MFTPRPSIDRGRRLAPRISLRAGSRLPLLAAAWLLTGGVQAQTTWHVDDSAAPGGNGLSWATAMDSLQSALDVATTADPIWVAAGTYHPTDLADPAQPRSARFWLHDPFQLYGGFDGTETSLAERDPSLFDDTILSGDIGVPVNRGDNAFRVVEVSTSFPAAGMALLDGFRITGGNAFGNGGGVLVTQTVPGYNPKLQLRNCTLNFNSARRGGAIAVIDLGVVRIDRCRVEGNSASLHGGALYARTGSVLAANSRFSENRCGSVGGVLFAESTDLSLGPVKFANCVFSHNEARRGAVAYLHGGTFFSGQAGWYSCTFVENAAVEAGGVLYALTSTSVPAQADIFNSILWNNAAPASPAIFGTLDVRFSDVQGGYPGAGNVNVDPLFTAGDTPGAGSPVNDAGSNALLVNDYLDLDGDGDTAEELPLDLQETPRRGHDPSAPNSGAGTPPIVDMGAYELDPGHVR